MMTPLHRCVVWTMFAMILASPARGQGQKVADAERARTGPAQTLPEVRPVPPEMMRRFQGFHALLQPSVKPWVEQQAHVVAQQSAPNVPALEAAIRNRFSGSKAAGATPSATGENRGLSGGLSDIDIEAVVFIVMMQAAQDAGDDLNSIMQQMKSVNEQKQELRQIMDALNQARAQGSNKPPNAPCATLACQSLVAQIRQFSATAGKLPHPVRWPATDHVTYGEIAQLQQQIQQNANSLGEQSETQSLELQMTMDRRSKLLDTLSNVLKTISDTSDSVVQNLK